MPMDQEIPALVLQLPRKPLPSPRFRLTHDFQIRKRRLQPRHHQSHVGCQRSQQITPISFVGACSSHQGVSGAPYSGASFHSPFPALDFEFPSRLQLSCRSSIATTSPHSSSSPFSYTNCSTPRGVSVHPPNRPISGLTLCGLRRLYSSRLGTFPSSRAIAIQSDR